MAVNMNYVAEVGVKVSDTLLKAQLKSLSSQTVAVKLKVDGGTSRSLNAINKSINSVTENSQKLNSIGSSTFNGISNSLNKASKHTKTLGQDFVDTLGKVAKFGAVTSILGVFTSSMQMATQTVKDFDDAITDFKKVSSLSGDELDSYTVKLGELGKSVARTRTEMIQDATIFKQSGYNDSDSANLAQVASLFQNVADAEVSASDASGFLVAEMKAFNISAKDATTIVDSLNIVSNNYAVSSSDISEGLSKSSASLSAYGNTMSETMGLITAG